MSTTTNVQQVKVNLMTQQQYDTATKNVNEFYVITDGEYLEGITSSDVTTALGYTPYDGSTNPNGYITGITSSDVTTALGYTPANDSGVVHLAGVETMTAAKQIFGVDADPSGSGQANLFSVISNNNSGGIGSWVGRMTVGAKDKTFLLGTYNHMCAMGAHSWTNAQAGTGAAWEPIYINPDGTAAVYIGGSGWVASSGWLKVDNSTGKTSINIGTIASPVWVDVAGIQTLQNIQNNGASGALSLSDKYSLYKVTPTGATTISFGGSVSATSSIAYTFELCIDMSSSAKAITWPSVTWQGNEAPDLSEAGVYFFAFRTINGGTTWYGNLQGKW